MRFLIDNNLPPRFAVGLNEAGHDAVHLRDLGSANVADDHVIALAVDQDRVVVAQDADFGTLLWQTGRAKPSVVYFRRQEKSVEDLLPLLLDNLHAIRADLERGALIVFDDDRIRIRSLPIC